MSIKHFSVDLLNTGIVYNRKLIDGNGETSYGLLIAKSLMNDEFMKKCYEVKNMD